MSQNSNQEQQGIIVRPQLSIRWRHAMQDEDVQSSNHITFQIIEALEEHHASNRESHDSHSQEYACLDAKINLLIDLVGQLLNQQSAPPEKQVVQLSVAGVQWYARQTPVPDEKLVIELFLDARHGGSIQLPAHVVSVKAEQNGNLVQAKFDSLHESTRTHLEKWIFRAHRREVANKRQR